MTFTPKVDFFTKWFLLLFTISLPVSAICKIIYTLNSLQMKPDDLLDSTMFGTEGVSQRLDTFLHFGCFREGFS